MDSLVCPFSDYWLSTNWKDLSCVLVCLYMHTHELRIISNTIGFMYDWNLKSCVGSYVCAIIIIVINSLNDYPPLNTDFNLSLSDPTLYSELSRRPIFDSPRLLYLTPSGRPSVNALQPVLDVRLAGWTPPKTRAPRLPARRAPHPLKRAPCLPARRAPFPLKRPPDVSRFALL